MAPKRRKTQTPQKVTSNPPQNETGAGKEIQVTIDPPPPQNETVGREEIVVTIDPHSLECSICFEPLLCPVYQCILGHVACLLCWKKLENKCPTCNKPIGGQNIALEAVLESMRLPCTYVNFGCRKSVSYSQRQVHNDTCEFAPSLCPIPGCAHKSSSGEWRAHFIKDHHNTSPAMNYGEYYPKLFLDHEKDRYCTILGPGKDVFLLVKEAIPNVGDAFTLYYIDLPDLGRNYVECKLRVRGGLLSSSLQLISRVVSIKEWKRGEMHGSSLMLPSQFLLERNMKVPVMIVWVLLDKKKW